MSGVLHNNAAVAFQGFSISQPFLGAALHFYPEMGTKQLDDLINAYVPGSASILEKRATVSMDFFAYSQLTGETFKYYAVAGQAFSSTTSSAGSSPMQDSSYSSNFVSPVISDWSWSQSTSSSASVSTPTSVANEAMTSKTSKKAVSSAAKSQASDFSHLPGMKIMTKDGRDVTNSASRGCKTKEQRDHAHLMRIIKACDACKKKKVRCDPSHKKRTAAQSQSASTSAAPARLAKKVKTSARGLRAVTERLPRQNATSTAPSLLTEQAFAGLEIPDVSADLPESWESFVHFDDGPVELAPFDYDFFFDPACHFTPESSQSPVTPSIVFAQSQGGPDALQDISVSKASHNQLDVRSPTLPYLNSSAPANNYVDFSLYSPESSFLDDDVALLSDIGSTVNRGIGSTVNRGQGTLSHQSSLAQDSQSSSSQQVDIALLPVITDDHLAVDYGEASNGSSLGRSDIADSRRRCSIPRDGVRPTSLALYAESENLHPFTREQSVSLSVPMSQSIVLNSLSSTQTVRSQYVSDGDPRPNPPQPQLLHATSSAGGVLQGLTVSSNSLCSLGELSHYAQTRTTTTANGDRGVTGNGVTGTSTGVYLQAPVRRAPAICDTAVPLSSLSSVSRAVRLGGVQSTVAMVTGNSFVWKRRPHVNESSKPQLLICTVLLAAAVGIVATSLVAQTIVGGFFQIAFGLAMYKAHQSTSSHYDSRPQQSRLSTTLKLHGFGDGARPLSCVSTRLRHTCRQNLDVHCRVLPARTSMVLGLAQGFL